MSFISPFLPPMSVATPPMYSSGTSITASSYGSSFSPLGPNWGEEQGEGKLRVSYYYINIIVTDL